MMYWNRNTEVFYCNPANCSGTETDFGSVGSLVVNSSPSTQRVASLNFSCQWSSSFCIDWLNADLSVYQEYEDLYQPPSGGSSTYTSFIGAGTLVYWIAADYDAASTFVKASLFSADSTGLNRAQLAGGLAEHSTIVDVNDVSVILADASYNLYRVSLPLGLGSQSPQSMGVTGVAATEDASNLYWIDSQGTVYSCTKSSCTGTTSVRANGQSNADRILQDSAAVYWGRANPSEVMRLAK